MKRTVVAISGYKFSGKDSAANVLRDYGFVSFSFADPLKELAATQFNVPLTWMYDQTKKERPLLDLPVKINSVYTKTIVKFVWEDLRTRDGKKPEGISDTGMGYVEGGLETLFWTPRALCISVGFSARAIDEDHWVKMLTKKIENSDNSLIVVPDLRLKNEMEGLKKWCAENNAVYYPVRIERFDTPPNSSPSERELDKYPFELFLNNKGSLEELQSSVHTLISMMKSENI